MSDIMQSPELRIPGTSYYAKLTSKKLIITRYGRIIEEIPVEIDVLSVSKALEHFLRTHEFYHSKEDIRKIANELVKKYGMIPKPLPQVKIREALEEAPIAEPQPEIKPPPQPEEIPSETVSPSAEAIKEEVEHVTEAKEVVEETKEVSEEAKPAEVKEKYVTIIGCEGSIQQFLYELEFKDETFFNTFKERKFAVLKFEIEQNPIVAKILDCSATDSFATDIEKSIALMIVEYQDPDVLVNNILPLIIEHVGDKWLPVIVVDKTTDGVPVDKIRLHLEKHKNIAYIRPDTNVSVAFNNLNIILSESDAEKQAAVIKEINEVYLPKEKEKEEKKGFLKRLFG
ncbi:MAG: hypothetical protein ACP6IS_03800 [Candidatus Asgardarchaeia archaeon]